jgi:galactose oxidase-like protein
MRSLVVPAALVVSACLAFAAPAGAHGGHDGAGADPFAAGEAAHARADARTDVVQAADRRRWARLTPAQRQQRMVRVASQTRALNARLAGQRDDVGYWDQTLYPLPEWAINAIMLPTNKVLIFGREPLVGGTRSNRGSARLFDPLTGTTTHVPPPPVPENQGMEAPIFCSGQTMLSDGRVLIAGGNLSDPVPGKPQFSGLKRTFIFNPWTESWDPSPSMTHGRWYPTLTRLSSGDVLILGGLDENGQGRRNGELDILRPGSDLATPLTPLTPYPAGTRADPRETDETLPPDAQFGISLYPYTYLLPDGNVALAGPGKQDSAILDTATALNRRAPVGSAWSQIPPERWPSEAHQGGTTVMEPDLGGFAGSWNLLAMAGADDAGSGFHLAKRTVDRLDASAPGGLLGWTHDPQEDLNQARFYLNNVLLPDGGIVVVGGGAGADYRTGDSPGNYYLGDRSPALRQVELRRPGERSWRLGAAQQEWRTYHSTAWLLPDGRIVSAGDDGNMKLIPSRDDAEIYWPPYLFHGDACAPRPVIRGVGAPGPPPAGVRQWATLTYGERFGIFSEHAQAGMRAVLVAPAATTHGVDMNQRLVPLALDQVVPGGGLNATMPANANIAPPGYYMLFVVDGDGTPSEARWVHVLPPDEAAVERGGTAPAPVTTAWPDPQPRTCVDPPPPPATPGAPAPTAPSSTPGGGPSRPARQPAKLALQRATIHRASRQLDVLAPISALASGRVGLELRAAGRSTHLSSAIDARKRRIRVLRTIPAAQARLGTGILTLRYRGNDATLPQTVRLRAAARPAALVAGRPALDGRGRLRASGTISRRARGVVRVELQFATADGARTLAFRAPIRAGRWTLRAQLTRADRAAIADRAGTVQASTLFTGYAPLRMRGEMRSHQVLGAP